MRKITKFFVHCSYTRPSQDIGVEWIRNVHVNQFGWDDIGYHIVIRRNGDVELGRPVEVIGSHAKGHNSDSIGVCLIGGMTEDGTGEEFNFTVTQLNALNYVYESMCLEIGPIDVFGHNEVSEKACPCFNVKEFFKER